MGTLAGSLFTNTQQRVLGVLFGQPERSFYTSELINLAGAGRGSVQRELDKLSNAGLLNVTMLGNQKHFQANPDAPIFAELCSIIRKTVGLQDPIREALEPFENKISCAFLYGSVAKKTDRASSDIDLMIVAEKLSLEEIYDALDAPEKILGRELNPTLYSQAEFDERKRNENPFLTKVLAGPIEILMGEINAQ